MAAMFENICSLPLSSDLFTQALHPTEPILAVGLSAGHVQTFRLPPIDGQSSDDEDGNTSINTIDTQWRTRRHKGSCRTLAYSLDGQGMETKPCEVLKALLMQRTPSPLLRRH